MKFWQRWTKRLPRFRRVVSAVGDVVVNVLLFPVHVVVSAATSLGQIVGDWLFRRDWLCLLQGLPAFLLFVAVWALGLFIFFQDRNLLARQYADQGTLSMIAAEQARRAGKDAESVKPLAMAQTCFLKIGQLQAENSENRFRLGQILDMQQQPAAAEAIYRTLAPRERTGYGPAHLVLGKRALAEAQRLANAGQPSGPTLILAANHLLRAEQWNTESVTTEARIALYQLSRLRNQVKEAEDYLVLAAASRPEMMLELARWYLAQGKRDQANQKAQNAAAIFTSRLNQNKDDHASRLGLVQCLQVAGDFANAIKLVQEGMDLSAADPAREALVREYLVQQYQSLLAWFDALGADPQANPGERFALLEKALLLAPGSEAVLQRLVGFTRLTGSEAEKARKIFRELTDIGAPSAVAHMTLGMDAWLQNSPKDARYHWEKAIALAPGMPLTVNNLAWVLATNPPVDLNRALALIDSVLDKYPNEPRFHGTRGHILARMNRHQEALPELEIAKAVYSYDPVLFQQLAETCAALEMPIEAAHYKERTAELHKRARELANTPSQDPAKKAREVKPADPQPADVKPAGQAPARPKTAPTPGI